MNLQEFKKYYDKKNNECIELKKKIEENRVEIEKKIKDIDFEDIDRNYNYTEAKEKMSSIGKFLLNEDCVREFLKSKKEKEYPEILGVHYYPKIKEMHWLSEEKKIKLDKLLKISKYIYQEELLYFLQNHETLGFLMKNKIIKKEYVLTCYCGDWNCDKEIISEEKYQLYKKYWEDKDSITDEEYEEINYGYIELPCCHENIEIGDMEEFEAYLEEERYIIIKKPDLTLDNL